MTSKYYLFILLLVVAACNPNVNESLDAVQRTKEEKNMERPRAKFEPEGEQVLVFAGQDLESIGGLPEYVNGYVNHFPVPAGITLYTSLGPGDPSFGGEGFDGIYETVDHGNGPTNMNLILKDPKFTVGALAIGLSMVSNEEDVAEGKLDDNIHKLGEFLLSLGNRPVFLRIGYEFDGHLWNHYDREAYLKAYRRVKDKLDAQGVTNTAYVWQSTGWVSDPYQLEEWYPGDEYVDWCGYSFFSRWREVEMIDFARKKGKPVFIAEASATISDHTVKFDGDTKETKLSNPAQAQEAWDKWFVPFFDQIENNLDVVKAIHYINTDWSVRAMWTNNPTFRDVDARIQNSPMISEQWMAKMNNDTYLNASSDLYKKMGIAQTDDLLD